MDRRRRQPHSDTLYLMILMGQLWQQVERLPVKPLVTLAVIGLMVVAHVNPAVVPFLDYPESTMCMDHHAVLWGLTSANHLSVVLRVFGSPLIHASDHHLYYNCASLLWKGADLETSLGPGPFGVLLVMLILIYSSIFVLAGSVLERQFGSHCTIGFSGVLFALVSFTTQSQMILKSPICCVPTCAKNSSQQNKTKNMPESKMPLHALRITVLSFISLLLFGRNTSSTAPKTAT